MTVIRMSLLPAIFAVLAVSGCTVETVHPGPGYYYDDPPPPGYYYYHYDGRD